MRHLQQDSDDKTRTFFVTNIDEPALVG